MTNEEKMKTAIQLFDKHFKEFALKLSPEMKFTYTKVPTFEILQALNRFSTESLTVRMERLKGSTVALYRHNEPLTLVLNELHINKNSVEKIAGSIAHEFMHCVDHFYKGRFGHPKYVGWWNRSKANRSAPYMVGKMFKEYLETR